MKESLKIFGVTAAGFEEYRSEPVNAKDDEEVIKEAEAIADINERETYLRQLLESMPIGFVKSKRYLAELIKSKDPKHACDLVLSASKHALVDPENYFMFAKIAFEHNAWKVAKSCLEVAKWVCFEKHSNILCEVEDLLKTVEEKISSGENDKSGSDFWVNKSLNKYWLLERIFYQSDLKQLFEYSFKLLNTFPQNMESYDTAFKALSLAKNEEAMNTLAEHVTKNLNENKIVQDLYLGMCHYELSDFNKSYEYLKNVLNEDSSNVKALLYLSLTYLMKNEVQKFVEVFHSIVQSASDPIYIALYFIYSAITNYSLGSEEFPNQKVVSKEISMLLERLFERGQSGLVFFLREQFKRLNYFLVLPYLRLYLAELYIKRNELLFAKDLLSGCNDPEIHRLLAWIYRLEGQEDLAEKELLEYRKNWLPKSKSGINCQTVSLTLPEEVPGDLNEVFGLVRNAFNETTKLIKEFDLEYGLNAMTCIETGCQDCCKKTFPYVSYTEYLYIKDYLDKQPEEFKSKVYEISKKIVEMYREKYKKEPPIVTGKIQDKRKEYPIDFKFDCPFLGDNKCNIYLARPFTCRAYGYGSGDGVSYKGCTYFHEQFKGATKLNDVRKVINMKSFFDFVGRTDKKLAGEAVIAPIPVWFAHTHEENIERINAVLQSQNQ